MAFDLKSAAKNKVTSSVTASVSSVSNAVSAKAGASISGKIPGGSLSTNKVGAALLGGAIGGILDGAKGAAIGGLLGGVLSGGAGGLLAGIRGKLNGLVANSPELAGLTNTALKLVEKGAADLIGITGGEYGPTIEQYKELSKRTNITSDYIDGGFLPSYEVDDSAASKVPNPLRSYNGVNYILTLGVLSPTEYNNPDTYRSVGSFKNYVIQSAGGNLNKRYQVFDEHAGNVAGNHHNDATETHAEYYIDDVELDSIVAPNENTRMTLGTSLAFNVIEPYSMGNFIQALRGAAYDAGYANYKDAPFCFKIDFAGYNLDGTTNANFLTQPLFVPIKLINMDFSVSGEGSKYAVTAVPMSETGLADDINEISSPVKATGTLCSEVLETNDQSVTGQVNGAISDLEEAGALAPYDRYVICFPKNRIDLKNVLQKAVQTEDAFTSSPEDLEIQRQGSLDKPPDMQTSFSPETITIKPPNDTYGILKTFAEDTNLMNAIGLSPLNVDTNAAGNTSPADPKAATNPETEQVDPAGLAAQPADKARDHQFNQGEQITAIIEKIVLQTDYAAEKSTEGAKNGMNKWFRIDTHVYIDEGPLTEATMGRRPRVYVYSVIEYEIDQAVTMAGNQAPQNTKGLRALAQKEYNYIYSGKNEDVLNFDLQFNNAYIMTAYSDLGMAAGGIVGSTDLAKTTSSNSGTDSGVTTPVTEKLTNEEGSAGTELVTAVTMPSGYQGNDVRRKIAEMFHDKITKMNVDMVTAEMEILGDPYFIPQQTGNYIGAVGNNVAEINGNTMNYLDQSVFCIVNFRTPFDYQVKGATMEFPQIVPGFSGLFQIWAVVNRFAAGKFTQTIKLIRRKGQDDEATTANSGTMIVNNDSALVKDGVTSDGTVGGQQPGVDCFPAPKSDDIREINPAIGADIAAAATNGLDRFADEIADFKGSIESLKKDKNPFTQVADLSKVIPGVIQGAVQDAAFGAIASKVGGVGGLALGSLASDAVGGISAAAAGGYGQTSLQAGLAAGQKATDAVTASRAANEKIASVSGAAKSKASSLLGGPI